MQPRVHAASEGRPLNVLCARPPVSEDFDRLAAIVARHDIEFVNPPPA